MTTTPPPSNTPHSPFASRPQQYPKTQRKAAEVITQFQRLIAKGPRSLVATIIDTSFQTSMGYVLCTTELGIVQVHGVPYGSVTPQMRIFVRQLGPAATNRQFVFDGYAPALSMRGLESGSLLYGSVAGDSGAVLGQTSVGGMPSSVSLLTASGYYWHFFFYAPSLPALIPRCTVFMMENAGSTNVLACEYLSSGQLVFRCTNDGSGYTTNGPVAPHQLHWVQIQPGLAGGLELLVDGIADYSTNVGIPTFSGGGATYTGSFLNKSDGKGLCPLGTWISKFGYGYSYTSGAPVALSTGLDTPGDDSEIPSLSAGGTMQTQNLYLFTDTPGAFTAYNSAAGGTGSSVVLALAYANVVAPGPY